MKRHSFMAGILLLILLVSGLSSGDGVPTNPDFQITMFSYNPSSDTFMVRVKNNNYPSGSFEGNLSFGIYLNNTLVKKRYKIVDLKNVGDFDVYLFNGAEFASQVNLSSPVLVKVKVDWWNDYPETNENNNEYNQTIQFNAAATAVNDLKMHDIYKTPQGKIKVQVKNTSPLNNPFSGTIKIGWSVNEQPKSPLTKTIQNLHVGHIKEYELPWTLVIGRNAIWAKVDPQNQINETNENNNSKLGYFYPNIARNELMKNGRLGYGSKSRIITASTNPALITPDTIGPKTSATNRAMFMEVKLRAQGSEPVTSYKITVYCEYPVGTLRTYMPKNYNNGPTNGDIKKHTINIWVPKSAADANGTGKLIIRYDEFTSTSRTEYWSFNIKFQGF